MDCCQYCQKEFNEAKISDVRQLEGDRVSFTLQCPHCNRIVGHAEDVPAREFHRRQIRAEMSASSAT